MQARDQQAMESVASLLVPTQSQSLLVPMVTVAEMVPYSQPQAIDGAPEWLLGTINWRNAQVPLLSFEVMNGDAHPLPSESARIVVFNNTGVSEELPFIAMLSAGIPRLLRIEAGDLQRLAVGEPGSASRMLVGYEGNALIIPDLSALEQRYTRWRNGN